MHPDTHYLAATYRVRDELHAAAQRRLRPPRARPPSPRHRVARRLVQVAAALADEPVVALPRHERRLARRA